MAVSGWGIFLIFFFTALVVSAAVYIGYSHYRARQLGLPPPRLNPFTRGRSRPDATPYRAPAPAPGGIQGWLSDKWASIRNPRRSAGAYESTGTALGGVGGDRRGFGALDPDEAWDARVDHEAGAYYEENEIGLHADPHRGPYGGGGYGEVGIGGIEEGRGRSRSRQRELDARYEEEVHGGGVGRREDPFGDSAEPSNISLRSVSPRPYGGAGAGKGHKKGQASLGAGEEGDGSPLESRRSVFREDM